MILDSFVLYVFDLLLRPLRLNRLNLQRNVIQNLIVGLQRPVTVTSGNARSRQCRYDVSDLRAMICRLLMRSMFDQPFDVILRCWEDENARFVDYVVVVFDSYLACCL